jgi:octaprenyl-diphosphate synthase
MQNIIPAPFRQMTAQMRARQILGLVKHELAEVEKEFERQARSNIQIISHIGNYLRETGGKRIRPALLILAARVFGEEVGHNVIQMATVMEFLHTATLVHDDIIDGAETRRGHQAVSSRWGADVAVLMGDWLYMSAFETSLAQRNLEILDVLTHTTRRMTEGELMQLTLIGNLRITQEQHLDIVRRKTGYLFGASSRIGGILRGASEVEKEALEQYGLNLGIAFQLTDDLLDFTAEAETLGKPVLSDLRDGKVTLPLIRLLQRTPECEPLVREAMEEVPGETAKAREILALLEEHGQLDNARSDAYAYVARAQDALLVLPDNQFRQALSDIAQYVVERDK